MRNIIEKAKENTIAIKKTLIPEGKRLRTEWKMLALFLFLYFIADNFPMLGLTMVTTVVGLDVKERIEARIAEEYCLEEECD